MSNKTIKDIAIENMEISRKQNEFKAMMEKNLLENKIIEIISDNLAKIAIDVYDMNVQEKPIMEFSIPEKECESNNEEYIWQQAIMLLCTELREKLKKEGLLFDLARHDGNTITIKLFNYVSPLRRQENAHLVKNIKQKLKSDMDKEFFDEKMSMYSAKEYIKSLYDLDKDDWEKVPNHEKILEVLNHLYHKVLYKNKKKPEKNTHSSESSESLVKLIKTHRLGKHTLTEAIELGIVATTKFVLK